MKNYQRFLGRIILLLSSAAFLNQTGFAGNSCKKVPMQCSSLCQTDLLAEARAKELEKHSKKTRIDADKAARKAESLEKQVNKELQKIAASRDETRSGASNPKARSFWKAVGSIPRLFVSSEARIRATAQEKEAEKPGTTPLPDYARQDGSKLLMKAQMASKTAGEAQKVAADAVIEAYKARAYADSVRRSYQDCLSQKE